VNTAQQIFENAGLFLNQRTRQSLRAWLMLTALFALLFPILAANSVFASTAPTKRAEKVMIYGDSLAAAYGLRPSEGWVALLETRLKPHSVAVVNASISGETTRGGLARIEGDLKRHQPTIVVIALGANDGLRGLPVADTRKNIVAMLDAARRANARAVIVGIQIPPNYGIQYANDFKNLYPQLATERKLPLVPFLLDGIAESLDNFLPDGLHPNAASQPRILENVWPTLSRALALEVKAPTKTAAAAR
jgi:acyl-CoA thioesterase I